MTFEEWMEAVVHGFEIVGVAILVAGSIAALAQYVLALARKQQEGAFARVRHGVGRAILLGLEVPHHRRHRAHHHRGHDAGKCADTRACRLGSDVSQLLPRDRARRVAPVAACRPTD
ncbi:MAG TPA: hypothetical protein VFD47_07100 [Actinomycetota bacterium]|nr:hypothetical protein [Actinomycetota bacterium]